MECGGSRNWCRDEVGVCAQVVGARLTRRDSVGSMGSTGSVPLVCSSMGSTGSAPLPPLPPATRSPSDVGVLQARFFLFYFAPALHIGSWWQSLLL